MSEAQYAGNRWALRLTDQAERIAFEALNENDEAGLALLVAQEMIDLDLVLPMRYHHGALRIWRIGQQAEILTCRDSLGRWLVRSDGHSQATAHKTIREAFEAVAALLGVFVEDDQT